MPLDNTNIYSHVTFHGSLKDQKTIDEIAYHVLHAETEKGRVNIKIAEEMENGSRQEDFYVASITGNKLYLDRRSHNDRRKEEDRRESSRSPNDDAKADRRKHRERRAYDIGHMPKAYKISKIEPADT
jgi:hypothetical protein